MPFSSQSRELLRVEVLEARVDGAVKFCLRFHNWQGTRADGPCVKVEIKTGTREAHFVGYIHVNEAGSVLWPRSLNC